ncbi:up-regulator of cell proliferation-like [Seriola dumerili]|uniref:up-regulator of cell proliferation-like n=1 Tax=Seriola dumerili TaxID=41447 RepID=UPI000BBE78AE|nr:up-regulator of cell proliferation-like [Seriola dumerili]
MATEGTSGLLNFLSKLGLEKFYPNKLTLRSLLEINKNSISDGTVQSVDEIPWCFLRKLLKVNAECRNCTQLSNKDGDDGDGDEEEENNDLFGFDKYTADDSEEENKVNPLDLIVALFLCADSFLQQQMALKMSMCQFPVPLLLPHGKKNQCTLMLWALRTIVKEWCSHDLSESEGFVEENIVQANIPLYSFVRLKNCSLSKSQIMNQVLSRGQQNHSIFIQREMEGGAIKRKIANGLVEVCWYLPCGRGNLDIFPKPIAFANLRGDINESITQFNFLFQVSTATFVFLDRVEEAEHRILTSLQDVRSKLFLVVNRKAENGREDMMSVKTMLGELDLTKASVKIKDSSENGAVFSQKVFATIKKSLADKTDRTNIEHMLSQAVEFGLSVDECRSENQNKVTDEILKGIDLMSIRDYKKQELPLQGENWKRLSKLEKEECRLTKSGDSGLEEYKSQLQEEKQQIMMEQRKYKMTKGIETFIQYLSTNDKEKRDFFLKWMKLKLDKQSRNKLSNLRNAFKEECKKKDTKLIKELNQALLDSSLGIEHYMREMGLIYEFSLQLQNTADEISRLPGLAAEMLLDGYPLELLDGDASNIPERWVTDVLMELHNKVGQKSRLLVLTVLGVQSTGKSTLLNTMFGVQFPVSSGRCTRGAFMLFLKVGRDMQSDMNCDFIVLIDTEGLKSPHMAHLEDSYEHDNQLATFVTGLSDVIIINIAMENWKEMKDVLQIATHAFLRMKQISKKPVCHFVHQNVGAVSAQSRTITDRKHLLDQLNEMTQLAAEMEKQSGIKAFTDVLEYDIEKNNWNIPGLWHGTPPMASVNTGYSEAVANFKKNLLETVKSDTRDEVSKIPEFLEWMRSLWKAVKYENFIFSFRNTLVAHAYDNLCKEFNQWEWEFRKEILSWQSGADLEILNADNESQLETWNRLVETKKSEVSEKITDQQTIMKKKLSDYYKRKDRHVTLIEKYKGDFINNINSLANEIKHSVCTKLDCTLELKISTKKAQDIQRKYRGVIEERVMKLLGDCKESTLSDEQLTCEFEKMWVEATVNVSGLKERDIAACVWEQLRKNFSNLNVNEKLQNIRDQEEIGRGQFKIRSDHVDSFKRKCKQLLKPTDLQSFADSVIESCTQFIDDKMWVEATVNVSGLKERDIAACVWEQLRKNFSNLNVNEKLQNIRDQEEIGRGQFKIRSDHVDSFKRKCKQLLKPTDLQSFADSVIESCTQFIDDKVKTNGDYHDSFTKDLLEKIDTSLSQSNNRHKTTTQFEIDLKLHICGIASRKFLQMHRKFLSDNDPRTQLEKYKNQYLSDFLDLFKETDHCKRKATDFVEFCIRPAVEEYINRSLGVDIVDEILTSSHSAVYSSRSFFQYSILKELLEKEDFESFVKYIGNYEIYIKDLIFQHILQKMSKDTLCNLRNKNLQVILKKITGAIEQASKGVDSVLLPDNKESITELINNMRKYLIKDISFSVEAEKTTLFQIQSTCHPFINSLKISINDLKEEFQEEFSNSNSDDITETLKKLPVKPQDELFKRVFGCGHQCPFCQVPCEAGGKEHRKHHAAIHWPQGLARYRNINTKKIVTTLCTTEVNSNSEFSNADTKWKSHPYKDYTTYYPDWHIPPDNTIEASDYWKYVLVQYNKRFAQEFKAKPADVPEAWRKITKEHALNGLKDAFNIK